MSETIQQKAVTRMKKYSGSLKNLRGTEQQEEETLSLEIIYYPDGRTKEELRFNKNGQVEEQHEYIYDSGNRIIMHNWSMPLDEVEQSERTERDEEGRVTREVKLYYGEEGESASYSYDDKGRMCSVKYCDEEGALVQEEKITFNDQDKVASRTIFDGEGKQVSGTIYMYNDKGLLTGQEEVGAENEKLFETVFEYDEQGNEINIIRRTPKNQIAQRVINTYDEHNRVIKRLASSNFTRIYTYEYDEAGRLADETATDENGTLVSRSSFQFDAEGRLIHETSYEMDLTHSARDMAMAYRYEYFSE
jgi:YD repeat-containing protein